jgi:hypothetical protein
MSAVPEIINKALPTAITSKTSAEGLGIYIAILWRTIITVGGLAFLLYLVWGGIEWLMAGDDKGKIEGARLKITQAIIGLTILVGSFAVVTLVQNVLQINILKAPFENNI